MFSPSRTITNTVPIWNFRQAAPHAGSALTTGGTEGHRGPVLATDLSVTLPWSCQYGSVWIEQDLVRSQRGRNAKRRFRAAGNHAAGQHGSFTGNYCGNWNT